MEFIDETTTQTWDARHVAVAVDGLDRPTVAYGLNGVSGGIGVRRWNGSAWQTIDSNVDGVVATDANVQALDLKLTSKDAPVLAWVDGPSASQHPVRASYWQSSRWFGFGGATEVTSPSSVSWDLSLAVSNEDRPSIAWVASVDRNVIYAANWDGAAWAEAAPGSYTGDGLTSSSPMLGFHPAIHWSGGALYVAQKEQNGGTSHVRVARHTSSDAAFVSLDGLERDAAVTPYRASFTSLATLSDGSPVIAFADNAPGGIHVLRWNGTTWIPLDSRDTVLAAATSTGAWFPKLFVDDRDSVVLAYIHWEDQVDLDSGGIHLRVWRGGGWSEAVPGSAVGYGISGASEKPATLSLGGHAGTTCVAWTKDLGTSFATRVACIAL